VEEQNIFSLSLIYVVNFQTVNINKHQCPRLFFPVSIFILYYHYMPIC
jgi:hypothetical protein